jgi:uncharacterized membrane protein YgdD (TMEM256/DUF423 family)
MASVGTGAVRIIDNDNDVVSVTNNKLDVNATLVAGATIDIGDVDMFLDGGTAILGGAGAVASGVLRVTLASDDPAVTVLNASLLKITGIDSDTNAIKTALEIIDNAIHVDDGDFTLNSSSGIAMMGFKGSQNITSGDVGVLTCNQGGKLYVTSDTSSELKVQIWSNTDTDSGGDDIVPIVDAQGHFQIDVVSGTVTANLSATDNAVLDAMVVDLAAMEALLIGIDVDTNSINQSSSAAKDAMENLEAALSGSELQVDVVAALPAGSNAIGKLAANSGVDIGDVDVTSTVQAVGYGTVSHVARNVTGSAVQLASLACKHIDIMATIANTGIVYMGASGVSATTGIALYPGDVYSVDITNTNLLYAISTVSGDDINIVVYS